MSLKVIYSQSDIEEDSLNYDIMLSKKRDEKWSLATKIIARIMTAQIWLVLIALSRPYSK